MNDLPTQRGSRRQHQNLLARKRRRLRKRRLARIRRIRFWRTVKSVRFWTSALTTTVVGIGFIFWAKFAIVLNVPSFAQHGALTNTVAYITVKPWWFGPPVFNLDNYVNPNVFGSNVQQFNLMLQALDRYGRVVTMPELVWVKRAPSG